MFVDQGMWEARKFFTYAKSGFSDPLFSDLFQQDTLIDYDLGDRTVKTLKNRGDYLRFMYGSTYNGDTFTTIINDLADFIQYYSFQLAQADIMIPTYDYFTKGKPPLQFWYYGVEACSTCQYISKNYLCDYGLHPKLKQRILAYDAFLTWVCMTALVLAYIENDASDIQGLHGGQGKVQEFLKSPAVQAVTTCDANLMWGMLFFYRLHDIPLLCEYGALSGADEEHYNPHVDSHGYKSIRNAICTKMIISETRQDKILNFWQLYPLTAFDQAPENYRTTYYQMWYLLTPTWHHILERTSGGHQLLQLNEIFRGPKAAAVFNKSISKQHGLGHLNSDHIYILETNANPQTLFGMIESGPRREYPAEIIRNMTSSNYLKTSDYQDHSLLGTIVNDDTVSRDINTVTADHLAKLGVWTYCAYYRDLHPKHSEDSKYHFHGMQFQRDVNGTKTATNYNIPTRYLGTETVNCSDLIMGCGYGLPTIHGSGMYLFNKYIPPEMTAWFNARLDDFKKVFKLAQSRQGKNYLTVYRPFTPNIFVDNVNVNCDDLLSAPFSLAGNRIQEQGILRAE